MLTLPRLIHPKQAHSEHDILMLLNFELSAYDECADCHFTAIRHTPRDETGSNWQGAHLEIDGRLTERVKSIARQVLDEVHEEYNLD